MNLLRNLRGVQYNIECIFEHIFKKMYTNVHKPLSFHLVKVLKK